MHIWNGIQFYVIALWRGEEVGLRIESIHQWDFCSQEEKIPTWIYHWKTKNRVRGCDWMGSFGEIGGEIPVEIHREIPRRICGEVLEGIPG